MQVRGPARSLYPGSPACAPAPLVMVEALVALLRRLHRHSGWTARVNTALYDRLQHAGRLADVMTQSAVPLTDDNDDQQKQQQQQGEQTPQQG